MTAKSFDDTPRKQNASAPLDGILGERAFLLETFKEVRRLVDQWASGCQGEEDADDYLAEIRDLVGLDPCWEQELDKARRRVAQLEHLAELNRLLKD